MPGLGADGRRAADAILTLDPTQQFVALDLTVPRVRYCDEIVAHENIGVFTGDEEVVRAYVVAWLCTQGGYSPVNMELEKRYPYGRGGSCELDILVKHADGTPYALIELKSPDAWQGPTAADIDGQLFAPASREHGSSVLCYATVEAAAGGDPVIRSITIAFEAGLTYTAWASDRTYDDHIPVNYGEPVHTHFENGGSRPLRSEVSKQQLDRMRAQLHNKLWGGSRDDNAIYAYVVKLFLTKIHDEKFTARGERYQFQIYYTGSTRETPQETFARINDRYLAAHTRYISPEQVEPLNAADFSAVELAWVVELLQEVSLTAAGRTNGDILGAFFEAITRDGFKQSKGLFFTHYNLAVFMLAALDVPEMAVKRLMSPGHTNDRLPYIIDPSSGSGTFLLAAMRMVTQHVSTQSDALSVSTDVADELAMKFPAHAPNQWAKDFIFGVEKREDLSISSKVNMVLHHDGHTNIYHADGLLPLGRYTAARLRPKQSPVPAAYSKLVAETFDVIVTNPPFSTTLDQTTRAGLENTFELANDPNSENLFLERWYQLLKAGGRLAAVLPESFFSTAENTAARIFLLGHFKVRAIVTLPPHAFQPWTPTRTSILFAEKKTPAEDGPGLVPSRSKRRGSAPRRQTPRLRSESSGTRASVLPHNSWTPSVRPSRPHVALSGCRRPT